MHFRRAVSKPLTRYFVLPLAVRGCVRPYPPVCPHTRPQLYPRHKTYGDTSTSRLRSLRTRRAPSLSVEGLTERLQRGASILIGARHAVLRQLPLCRAARCARRRRASCCARSVADAPEREWCVCVCGCVPAPPRAWGVRARDGPMVRLHPANGRRRRGWALLLIVAATHGSGVGVWAQGPAGSARAATGARAARLPDAQRLAGCYGRCAPRGEAELRAALLAVVNQGIRGNLTGPCC